MDEPRDSTRYVIMTWRDSGQRSHAFARRKRRSMCSRVHIEEHEETNRLPRCATCLHVIRTRVMRPPKPYDTAAIDKECRELQALMHNTDRA